ncbi:hypothetical protein FACS18942_10750 [Planctomycetales bacterium]|nr:hypothetical protein FACS18942_10750 [Planctomycetales bacterium]
MENEAAGLNPRKLVFVDESGAKTNMTRRYARSPKGKPIVDKVPYGHWQNITYVLGGAVLLRRKVLSAG